jgi:hypothetical protein
MAWKQGLRVSKFVWLLLVLWYNLHIAKFEKFVTCNTKSKSQQGPIPTGFFVSWRIPTQV